MFVEKEVMDRAQAVRVMVGAGREAQMSRASFVGSDWQTNTTVLKLDRPLGEPVSLVHQTDPLPRSWARPSPVRWRYAGAPNDLF